LHVSTTLGQLNLRLLLLLLLLLTMQVLLV
jgi:hypothetical protein